MSAGDPSVEKLRELVREAIPCRCRDDYRTDGVWTSVQIEQLLARDSHKCTCPYGLYGERVVSTLLPELVADRDRLLETFQTVADEIRKSVYVENNKWLDPLICANKLEAAINVAKGGKGDGETDKRAVR